MHAVTFRALFVVDVEALLGKRREAYVVLRAMARSAPEYKIRLYAYTEDFYNDPEAGDGKDHRNCDMVAIVCNSCFRALRSQRPGSYSSCGTSMLTFCL